MLLITWTIDLFGRIECEALSPFKSGDSESESDQKGWV